MAKFCLKKPSKRIQARKRYKIEKKVKEHNRKLRKEAKKHQKAKPKVIQVPNQCPFKENILKEVEALKIQKEEEKQRRREETSQRKKDELIKAGLEGLIADAKKKQMKYDVTQTTINTNEGLQSNKKVENSLKAYYKEFKKVFEEADVILEVVDARDPLGTRSKQVEDAVQIAQENKRLVIVLNKADLIPRQNLDAWLKYLRKSFPTVAFKSSTQEQSNRLGRRKLGKKREENIQGGTCFGAELLLSLLGNYCRSFGNVKTSITVGVVGLPNVGKSSVINSLKRNKSCNVGNTPGVTKSMQIVQLDSKIKLLDSPGIVFENSKNINPSSIALKNVIKVESLQDPFTPAELILKRLKKQELMSMYDVHEFETSDEFFAKKAARMGRFKKGGVPDTLAAARSIITDWNSGKIRYFTEPPEEEIFHVSAKFVNLTATEFNFEKFAGEEKILLDSITANNQQDSYSSNYHVVGSLGSNINGDTDIKKEVKVQKFEKTKSVAKLTEKKKKDPLFEIEGNQKLNKIKKMAFKKKKKEAGRRAKQAGALADVLDAVKLSVNDSYNFKTDFTK